MATQLVKIVGKAFYPKLFEQLKDTKFDPEGAYNVSLIVDEDMADYWDSTGAKGKAKYDRTTKQFQVKFTRKHASPHEWAGGPPKVTNPDGSIRTYEDGVIWNDSVLECTVSVYDLKMGGKGTRLESVKIISLADAPDREEGDAPTPPPARTEPPKTKAGTKAPIADEIPF